MHATIDAFAMIEIFDDIKSKYRFRAPSEELRDCIEYYWESASETEDGTPFVIKLFPSWTPTMSINLSAPYHIIKNGNSYLINQSANILHFRDSTTEFRYTSTVHQFGIKFFPAGLHSILDIDYKLFDNLINLDQLLPAQLIQKIRTLDSFDERVNVLQDYFLLRYKERARQKHHIKILQKAITSYGESNMELSNTEVAGEAFISPKTLYRTFKRFIGVPPKNYLAIMRARAALTTYVQDRENFSPFDYGYYDMSHFYKDVVMFTGKKLIDQVP